MSPLINTLEKTSSEDDKTQNKEKVSEKSSTGKLEPDEELLLFLSEFADSEGDWVDPEVFNNTNMMNSNDESKEKNSESRSDNN